MFTVDLHMLFFFLIFFFIFYNILLYSLRLAVCWEVRVTSLTSISLQESFSWVMRACKAHSLHLNILYSVILSVVSCVDADIMYIDHQHLNI